MSHSKVRRLLTNKLLTGLGYTETTPSKYPVLFNGVQTEPEESMIDTNITVHLIPVDTYSDTLSGDHKAFVGIYQMKVRTDSLSNGMLVAEQVADELQVIFKVNDRALESQPTTENPNPFTVQVVSPIKVSEGKQQGAWWEIFCYFDYRADTN